MMEYINTKDSEQREKILPDPLDATSAWITPRTATSSGPGWLPPPRQKAKQRTLEFGMAHLYDRVLSTVTKSPIDRTESEIEQIMPWFRKRTVLFRSLKLEIIRDIVKNCRFTSCTRDTVIITQGQEGDNFYIILSGQVSIYINASFADEEAGTSKTSTKRQSLINIEDQADDDIRLGKPLERVKYGNFVGKLGAGHSFGELALINKDCVRNASCISDDVTDLLIVNRDLYNRSLRAHQAQEYADKLRFVSEFPLFSNWQPRFKKMMAMSLKKETLPFESTIVRQGDAVDGLYFLQSGQAKIVVDSSQHSTQFPNVDLMAHTNDKDVNLAREPKYEKAKGRANRHRSPFHDVKRNTRNLELCVIGPIELIGDLESTMGLDTYAESVVCTEESSLYFLNNKNFERLIEKKNPQAIETMRELVHTKLSSRLSRLHTGQVRFFDFFLRKLDENDRLLKDREKSQETDALKRSDTTINECSIPEIQSGPLIDQYGPGSVFYMIRMRHRRRKLAFGNVTKQSFIDARKITASHKQPNDANRFTRTSVAVNSRPDISIVVDPVGDYQGTSVSSEYNTFHTALPETSRSPSCSPRNDLDTNDTWGHTGLSISDGALSHLERRIQAWHNDMGREAFRPPRRTILLHRYTADETQKPKPGSKIYLRRKQKTRDTEHRSTSPALPVPLSFSIRPTDALVTTHADNVTEAKNTTRSQIEAQFTRSRLDLILHKQPTISRQYSVDDYNTLRDQLRQKQRTYTNLLQRQPSEVF